jgi:hypothetical protein
MASMQADAVLPDGWRHTLAKYGLHRFSAEASGPKARQVTIQLTRSTERYALLRVEAAMQSKQEFVFGMCMCGVTALLTSVICAAQITVAPPPDPNLTPPGKQRQAPQTQRTPVSSTTVQAHSPSVQRAPNQGVVSGYVFWDPKLVAYSQATPCQGITLFVQVGNPPQGQLSFEQFQTLTSDKNFTSLPKAGPYSVCAYSVSNIPTGPDLQVLVRVDPTSFPTAASSAQTPPTANDPNHPIKIAGGSCNKLPPAVPSATVLTSGWWTCGNDAYNVNFVLQPANPVNTAAGGGTLTIVSGTTQSPATSGQLLNGSIQSPGMLQSVSPGPSQLPTNPQATNPAGTITPTSTAPDAIPTAAPEE